jgi:CRISPR-associated RAMP protein (TIGR02581 family)
MWELKSKYLFKGILEMKTALHIGGGKENYKNTDSPVVRTPDGYPFIPGSSFKGAFRSTVEKLAVSVPGISTCQLIDEQDECPTVRKEFPKQKQKMKEDTLVTELEYELCCTCKLFGSPWSGSKIFFHDMKLKTPSDITEVRDGVMIDRDSERAVDQHKYDFETVPSASEFEIEIMLENPSDTDLGLTCIGLNEFISEMAYLGGIKSRGLGNCRIRDLKIFKLDLEGNGKEERLKKYLIHTKTEEKMEEIKAANPFIQSRIEQLFNRQNSEKEV